MDYVNMREFPSSRSRCHSQIVFPTETMKCTVIQILFILWLFYMNVTVWDHDKNFTMIISDSHKSSSLSSIPDSRVP
ncbi:hypothetical protein T12_2629 [Trichinella patagoniensis]|uniref:Uncharacterized protein n=1 Tax=Trichinella patagoniensis TaxID=990121 RepID=A0A0V0Z6I5_9BILA|nr:hypothetical protein T12_2629 [Trichinella patagoniensis]